MASFSKPNAILMDIEGTTTDASWVSKTLFPFIKSNIARYFEETSKRPETQELIKRFRAVGEDDETSQLPKIAPQSESQDVVLKSAIKHAVAMTDNMKMRSFELKQLQMLVWSWGYEKGLLKGHVYDEVTRVLHVWKYHHQIELYVLSSGMVTAQKLLLCCTNHGNVLPLINGFFDSSVGEKTDSEAFTRIADRIEVAADQMLFITDNPEEAIASIKANYKAALISRSGKQINVPSEGSKIPVIESFDNIEFK